MGEVEEEGVKSSENCSNLIVQEHKGATKVEKREEKSFWEDTVLSKREGQTYESGIPEKGPNDRQRKKVLKWSSRNNKTITVNIY